MTLDTVRQALIAEARADAAELTGRARAHADDRVEAARADVAEQVRQARIAAEADAEEQLGVERAAVRRQARRQVLQARRRARDSLVDAVVAALEAKRGTPAYDGFVDRLTEEAAAQLGSDARVQEEPPAGGVIATSDRRRVDYTIPTIVERVVDALGPEVEDLWR